MSTAILNSLAQHYVDLTLCKTIYDPWDVYWFADRPFWRRQSMRFSRDYKKYPYVDPGERKEGRTLQDIYDEADFLLSCLELYRKSAAETELERVDYLIDHVRNLRTRSAVLLGHAMSFDAMTDDCYGLVAPPYDTAELDAILAVALGGNSLGGGKFNLAGSIIGAYTIQAITTTLYALGVSTEVAPVFKAVVVIVIVAIQAPPVKAYFKKRRAVKAAAAEKEAVTA